MVLPRTQTGFYRFASFVASGSHLQDAELLDYDNYSIVRDVDDDDDDEELENIEPSILDDEENDVYPDSPAVTPARANRSSASINMRQWPPISVPRKCVCNNVLFQKNTLLQHRTICGDRSLNASTIKPSRRTS